MQLVSAQLLLLGCECPVECPRLVGKPQMRRVAQLFQIGLAGKVDHRWWTTHQHNRIVVRRIETGGDDLLVDESLAVFPVCGQGTGKM